MIENQSVRFFMMREVENPSVLFSLTQREFSLLWLLASKMDMSNFVVVSKVFMLHACDLLGVGNSRIYALLSSLVSKKALSRISNSDYMINPSIFFKCKAAHLWRLDMFFSRPITDVLKGYEFMDKGED